MRAWRVHQHGGYALARVFESDAFNCFHQLLDYSPVGYKGDFLKCKVIVNLLNDELSISLHLKPSDPHF